MQAKFFETSWAVRFHVTFVAKDRTQMHQYYMLVFLWRFPVCHPRDGYSRSDFIIINLLRRTHAL